MASNVTWNTLATYTWNQILAGTWDDPLPYPIVRARNQGAQVTDATSHVINLPAGVQAGDLLYVAFSIDTASTVTSSTSTGWAKLASDKQGTTTNQTGEVWWKRATGSDAFTITSSTAEQSTHISIALQNAADPVAVTANGASAASYTPPAITPAAGSSNYRAIISGHTDTSAGTTQTFGTAAGYSNSTTQQGSTTTTAATNTQEQNYTGVSTITPGAITLSLAEQWVAITTAIQRLSTPGGTAPIVSGSVTLTATPTLTANLGIYKPPDSFFDLSNWKITVPYDGPDGDTNADEIAQPALLTYVDPTYFYLDPSNQMVMDAPVNGDTTGGSTGVRTELREMDGAVESAWDKTTASRQLTVAGYFDPTNIAGGSAPKKVMIVGQIHETGGTPGIYLTVDYDASPSRLRVFKDGPGIGNLVTGFTPTDKLAFRIECTAGNVNIYGVIGDETALPASPQFTFPSSGFVEVTGSYLKTGSYNKTDTGTGSTGDSIAKITYLKLDQALKVIWPASVSLTVTPTLTVNGIRTTPASISLTATPTLTATAVVTKPATLSLTATPTLTISPTQTAFATLSLTVTPTLTANAIRTTPATISLSATPTLTVATPQLTTFASASLIVTPTFFVDAIRSVLGSLNLTILPNLVIPGNLTQVASASLFVTPTLSVNGVRITPSTTSLTATPTLTVAAQGATPASITLTATPTITVDAVRTTPATISLTIAPTVSVTAFLALPLTLTLIATPTISVSPYVTRPASVSLIVTPTGSFLLGGLAGQVSLSITPTLTVNGLGIALPILSLIASPTLTVNGTVAAPTGASLSLFVAPTLTVSVRLGAFANFSGIAIPTLFVDAVRITPASISLSITPTLLVTAFRAQTLSVSLIVTPTLSLTLVAPGAGVALTITPTISVLVSYIGRPSAQLTASPTLTVGAYLTTSATLSLTLLPTLAVAFYGQSPATVSLLVAPTLNVDAIRYVPASITLTIIPNFQVNGVRLSFPAIDLTIVPTITLFALRTTTSSLYLLIIPTLYVKGAIEGAGPGWPIVFRVVSVDDGSEAVPSVQTQFKPTFAVQNVKNESGNPATVSGSYIDFEDVNV